MVPKEAINALLRNTLGYEIRHLRRPIDVLRSRQIDLVLDVGANVGQYASAIRRAGYANEIISFEPVKACYDALQARTEKDALWEVRHAAVGSEDGTACINVSDETTYSSLCEPSSDVIAFDKRAATGRSEEVPICKIDTIYMFEDLRVYLKIDTQGFEREVLLGAKQTLPKISAVQVEVGTMQLYEGQPSYLEVCRLMHESRFSVALARSSEHYAADGRLLDMDFVFINDRFTPKPA